jgi:hypothetical protein
VIENQSQKQRTLEVVEMLREKNQLRKFIPTDQTKIPIEDIFFLAKKVELKKNEDGIFVSLSK